MRLLVFLDHKSQFHVSDVRDCEQLVYSYRRFKFIHMTPSHF
jgi:hypothetical protein